jgi:hypothetical protein
MLEPHPTLRAEPRVARILPRDDKIHFLQAECQRDLEAALAQLQKFREYWFVADPPRIREAREALHALLEETARIRNATLEMRRQIEPCSR